MEPAGALCSLSGFRFAEPQETGPWWGLSGTEGLTEQAAPLQAIEWGNEESFTGAAAALSRKAKMLLGPGCTGHFDLTSEAC